MKNNTFIRWIAVATVSGAAFVGAYAFAQSRVPATGASPAAIAAGGGSYTTAVGTSGTYGSGSTNTGTQGGTGGAQGGAAGGSACACCGGGAPTKNGVSGTEVVGTAKLEGSVQKIAVDVTTTYNPNVIKLKAGVPAEIAFSAAQGCTGQVISQDLNFNEDLTTGPKTVKLPALQPGTYSFSCGMSMVFGKIVVE